MLPGEQKALAAFFFFFFLQFYFIKKLKEAIWND